MFFEALGPETLLDVKVCRWPRKRPSHAGCRAGGFWISEPKFLSDFSGRWRREWHTVQLP
jgi:hypothetical protein